jgi:hypothetical protein
MAVVFVQEFAITDRSTANYDYVKERLGEGSFEGLIVHTAGFDDANNVFRIVDVWETREHADRFNADRIQPISTRGLTVSRTRAHSRRRRASRRTNCMTSCASAGARVERAPAASAYSAMRAATWYFRTDVRRPGVSPAGIAFNASSPRA